MYSSPLLSMTRVCTSLNTLPNRGHCRNPASKILYRMSLFTPLPPANPEMIFLMFFYSCYIKCHTYFLAFNIYKYVCIYTFSSNTSSKCFSRRYLLIIQLILGQTSPDENINSVFFYNYQAIFLSQK